jgi:cobalt-zinc-cadmium efflux system outer membrane protein
MIKNWLRFILSTTMVFLSITFCFAQEQKTHSLKEALQTARNNNPVLQSERLNIDMAKSDVISAKIRPNLTLNHETVQMTNSADFENSAGWYRGGNREELWEISKPLQIAGQRKHKIDYAYKSLELEEHNYFETERNLFEEVATQWLDVWYAKKQLEIIESAKIQADSILLINEARYRNQVITQTDLFRTQLLVKQYNLEHKTALQEVSNQQNRLKFYLGATDEVQIDMTDEFIFPIPQNFEELLEQASIYRGDLKVAETYSEVSDSNIKLQKSLAYPQPEVGVIYNPQNSVPHLGFSASIDLPFFDRNQGERQKSQIQKDQAESELTTLKTKIENEIAIAYATYQRNKNNLEDFESLLEQSQTILDNVKYAYIKGGTTILDYLEAQNSWLQTQQQYYEVLQDYRQSFIQLLHTTGLINQLAL